MSQIKIVDEQGVEVAPQESRAESNEPKSSAAPVGDLVADQIGMYMFDLKPQELGANRAKLNTLIDYAKMKTDDHSIEGLKWALRSLSTKLGTPSMGERLLPYMHRFAYLELESMRIDAEKRKYLES